MFRFARLFLLAGSLAFAACNNAGSNQETSEEDEMAQFADDSEFKDQHEQPEAIGYSGGGQMITFDTPDGEPGRAYVIMPPNAGNKYLFVIHEWWGLNDQIKREADRLADSLGYATVMALDLYDGKVTDDPDQAGKLMEAVEKDRVEAIIKGAIGQAGADAEIATIGWCFGGGWSLRASIMAGNQGAGAVMYYGMPVKEATAIGPLKADVLGIFAKKDKWINEEVIGNFEDLAAATGKDLTVHWFDADHAFANPSSPRYNEEAAQEANALALDFLKEHL